MKLFFIAFLGALFQEFLHLLELYHSTTEAGFKKRLTVVYFVMAAGTVLLSAAMVWVSYADAVYKPSNTEILTLGAAAPALFKKAVSAATRRQAHAGGEFKVLDQVRAYFLVG